MKSLSGLLLLACVSGCTAIDDFGRFSFGGAGDGGAADGAIGDGFSDGNFDLSPVTCGGPDQPCCTTGDACLGGGCCVAMMCHASGGVSGSGMVCLDGMLMA